MTEKTGDTAGGAQSPAPDSKALLIALTISTGFFMDGMDLTILVTSIPQIAESFGVRPLHLSLAVTSYLLSLAIFIPISGWIADRFGARDVFCAAIVIFTFASALCGMSTSLEMMIACRVLQGLGGALLTPVGRLIMVRVFPKDQLVRLMAFMAIPGLLGPALGPLVGGFLTTYVSWRWIFYINIPIGIAGIVMAIKLIDNFRTDAPTRFDFRGFLLVGFGFAFLQLGLETVGRGTFPGWAAPVLLGLAAVSLTVYVLYARHRENPVLDLRLLQIRSFSVAMIPGLLCRTGIAAAPFLLPLMFQLGFGLSPMESGTLTFASTIGAITIRFAIPVILRKFGFRRALIGNSLIVGAMIAGMAFCDAGTPHWVVWAYLFVFGFVRSSTFTAIGTLGYADLTSEMASRGTSIASVVQQLAQSSGVALAAMLLVVLAGPGHAVTAQEFHIAFIIVGLMTAVSMLGFLRLKPTDGIQVSHYRPPEKTPSGKSGA